MRIDFETFSEADIQSVGAWCYAAHPTTEVICMAYAEGEESPRLWLPGDPLPDFVRAFEWDPEGGTLHAWNSFFERCIWHLTLEWSEVPLSQWHDTMALSQAMSLPRKLESCGSALELSQEKQKNKRGSYLIQRLSKPYRGERCRDPELLEEFYEYCQQDVVAEREIGNRLRPLTKKERKVWELDQLINIRGLPIDENSVDNAINIFDQEYKRLTKRLKELTGLENPASQKQFLSWAKKNVTKKIENLQQATLKPLIKKYSGDIKEALVKRLSIARTPIKKYQSIKNKIAPDGRLHGALIYCGAARTGRWASGGVNFQNLPRPSIDDTESCIDLFKHRDPELLEMLYDDTLEALSSSIRGMVSASSGKRLIIADYSAIEARVLAWVADQEDVLEVFRGDGKIYEHTASQIYDKPVKDISKPERFLGKVATLALGYQGGVRAFQVMAENYGKEIKEEDAEKIKSSWRERNKNIVQLWGIAQDTALSAVRHPGKGFVVKKMLRFKVEDNFLCIRLPSGRQLAYYDPEIEEGKYGNDQVSYMGTNTYTRKWERLSTYGGKLVENIIQAISRDLMAEAMLRVESAGYPLILTVHDELVAEVDENLGSLEEFCRLICVLPGWAKGLPITADGFECKRYRK